MGMAVNDIISTPIPPDWKHCDSCPRLATSVLSLDNQVAWTCDDVEHGEAVVVMLRNRRGLFME